MGRKEDSIALISSSSNNNGATTDSTKLDTWASAGGVFVSTRLLKLAAADEHSSSSRTLGTVDESCCCSSDSSTTTTTPETSWKSSASKEPHRTVPLMVSDLDKSDNEEVLADPAAALGKVLERASRCLPKTTSVYASNHIMVNEERIKRMIAPLNRLTELDAIAREHAVAMATQDRLFHMSSPVVLQEKFKRPTRRLGANVATGTSIRDIHVQMMKTASDKNNMLDRRFTHMGMASVRSSHNGKLYLCQLFRG